METDQFVERGIAVFSNWGMFGSVAVGFVMEGIQREVYELSLIGVAAIVIGFLGHLVINAYFGRSFSRGEAGLGLATLGSMTLLFTVAWLTSGLTKTSVWTGLTLIASLIVTGAIFLATRFGLKGAFSQFHGRGARGGPR